MFVIGASTCLSQGIAYYFKADYKKKKYWVIIKLFLQYSANCLKNHMLYNKGAWRRVFQLIQSKFQEC